VVRNPDGTTTTTTGISPDLIEQGAAALAGITGGVAGIGFRAGDALFGAILNAVRSDNTSNLLSIPSTFTLDNQEARFLVGQEIPITTGEALSPNFDNAFRTVQRQNVGITLQVRPQINAGGAIKMDLRVEVSSIAGPAAARSQDFILNKRESENTLVVEDGEIAVIGGLLDENERRTIEKIPLLGDLPVIGNLFRSRGRERNKTNLMIFIRPTIVRSPAEQRAVAARRYDYIATSSRRRTRCASPRSTSWCRDYMGTVPPNTPAELRPDAVLVDPTQLPGVGGAERRPLPRPCPRPLPRAGAGADAARWAAATSAGAAQMKIGRGQEVVLEESEVVVEPAIDAASEPAQMPVRIPYAFARKHGVVLVGSTNGHLKVAMREGADPTALIELRRWLARPFAMEFVAPEGVRPAARRQLRDERRGGGRQCRRSRHRRGSGASGRGSVVGGSARHVRQRAGHSPDQRPDRRCGTAGRQRHPHRAVRDRPGRADAQGRRAAGGAAPAAARRAGGGEPHQGDGAA
jgi:hypothetical protein